MKILKFFKKKEIVDSSINKENFPKPFFEREDFEELFYLLKLELKYFDNSKIHYVDENYVKKENHISLIEYVFLKRIFYDSIDISFENIFTRKKFNEYLEYSRFHLDKRELIKLAKRSILEDFFQNFDYLMSKIFELTKESVFFQTYKPFRDTRHQYIYVSNSLIMNLKIIHCGNCEIKFGSENNFENIILNYFNHHINYIRKNPEIFDFRIVKREIIRLKSDSKFDFLNSIIKNLQELSLDFEGLNENQNSSLKVLTENQHFELKELLRKWFLIKDPTSLNNLINLIIFYNEPGMEQKFMLNSSYKDFCYLLCFLKKMNITTENHIREIIGLNVVIHCDDIKVNLENYSVHKSSFNSEFNPLDENYPIPKPNRKNKKNRKLLIEFINRFDSI